MLKKMYIAIFAVSLSLVFISCGVEPDTENPPEAPKTYGWQWDDSISIMSADGTTLSANIFVPTGSEPGEIFPALVMPATWALPEEEYFMTAKEFCKKGYIVLSYNARGWWESGGEVNVAGPGDMEDVNAVIDWLCDNTDTDVTRIGMCGISYGAGISLLGAVHDDRVRTVYSMCGWGDLKSALYPGETAKHLWTKTMLIDTSYIMFGTLEQEIHDLYNNLKNYQDYDETLEYARLRSPAAYVDIFNERNIPVGFSNNLQDCLFPVNTILPFYKALHTDKRLDLHRGIHAFTNDCIGALGVPSEIWNNCHAWFDYYFKGIETGILDRERISTEIKNTGERIFLNDLDEDTEVFSYYLNSRGSGLFSLYYGDLADHYAGPGESNTIESGSESGATLGIPLLGEILEAHSPIQITALLPLLNRTRSVTYLTRKFPERSLIVGIPSVEIMIRPSQSVAHIMAYLYTVDSLGIGTLISHGPLTLREVIPGEEVRANVELFFTAAYVPPGHHLALVLDTQESSYYVKPEGAYSVDIMYDEATQMHIPFVR